MAFSSSHWPNSGRLLRRQHNRRSRHSGARPNPRRLTRRPQLSYRPPHWPVARITSICRGFQAVVPPWMGYFFQVIVTQLRRRATVLRLVRSLGIDVVHQPTPVSPRVPSFLVGLPVLL